MTEDGLREKVSANQDNREQGIGTSENQENKFKMRGFFADGKEFKWM
jgi:hypothetical protein